MKKSKDDDELDTPTKLMIDEFLKFDHNNQDTIPKVRLYMIDSKQ